MDGNEVSLRRRTEALPRELSIADIEAIARLLMELREITLSRATYAAATDFLRYFGFDVGDSTLVRPEKTAE
jgi:hypothetical protein